MADKYPYLDVFPCCAGLRELCGGLQNAYLTSVIIDREARTMLVDAFFARMPAPAETHMLEQRLCSEFALESVELRSDFPRAAPAKEPEGGAAASKQTVLMGKAVRGKPVTIDTLSLDSGSVTEENGFYQTTELFSWKKES